MSEGVRGLTAFIASLNHAADQVPGMMGRALLIEANIEATEMKEVTPVDEGILKGSIHVEGPFFNSDGSVWVKIVCGGEAEGYAWFVHENPDAYHEVGGWKFIEGPLLAAAPHLAARIAKRLDITGLFG